MAFSAQKAARAPVFAGHAPAAPAAPAGTFAPGTKILVGSHKVVIQKYLAEGGFAHVYLVKMPEAKNGTDIAVLKRVAVPDKEQLANMRTEVETMKKLKGHRAIVTYYDSHASQLQGGGYEVFVLMEFCNGGGLIDFMNTRLQNRLTEPEIAKIFSDVAEGVACMHYLNPPLLHRDLKVENVLINESGGVKKYKLCDFGSSAPPRKAGKTADECRQILDDVMRHTTQQYRSPEMVDPHNGQDIDEKSDIWALGVFLYKLCYFTTPFEEQGQLAILNASFKYPAHPQYSDKMKHLIASMLQVDPRRRPNVYQVLQASCKMLNVAVPIRDIYSDPAARRAHTVASPPVIANSPPVVGAVFSPPRQEAQVIPEITRMARGRPQTASRTPAPIIHKPSPSPMRIAVSSDPFAALDSKSAAQHEDASNRFPSLDQFSLLHEQGSKFEFSNSSPPTTNTGPKNDLSKRVTEKLADDFFATAAPPKPSASPFSPAGGSMSRAQRIISGTPELQATISQQQPTEAARPASPVKPYKPSSYVSHGVQTSPDSPALAAEPQRQQYVPPPIHRFPPADDHHRSSSLSRGLGGSAAPNRSLLSESPRPVSVSRNRSFQLASSAKQEQSPRSSLDSRRPSPFPQERPEIRQRPSSAYLETQKQSKPGFFSKALPKPKPSQDNVLPAMYTDDISRTPSPASSDSPIDSNVEFLRQMEESDKKNEKEKRNSIHKHVKRASLPIRFAEKFGETFRRFETNTHQPGRTPSPLQDDGGRQLGGGLMTPIAGSEATGEGSDGRRSAELRPNELTGEQRREQERKILEDEERRVEIAAREYKTRLAEREAGGQNGMPPPRSIGGVSKASSIQNKVKSLLGENERPSEVQRTAQGYGKYTDGGVNEQARQFESDQSGSDRERGYSNSSQSRPFAKPPAPLASRKPIIVAQQGQFQQQQFQSSQQQPRPESQGQGKPRAPPGAKPKPVHLTGGGGGLAPSNPYANASPRSSNNNLSSSPPKQSITPVVQAPRPSVGSPEMLPTAGVRDDWSAKEKEDYLHTFKKRYPSLSGIEMVETTIGGEERRPTTGRASKEVSRVV